MCSMPPCGELPPAVPATPEVQKLCTEVKPQVEKKLEKTFDVFNATQFKTKSMGGDHHFVKVHAGGDEYVHMYVYQPPSEENKPAEVRFARGGLRKDDALGPPAGSKGMSCSFGKPGC